MSSPLEQLGERTTAQTPGTFLVTGVHFVLLLLLLGATWARLLLVGSMSLLLTQGPKPRYPNNMVLISSRRRPEGKAMMLVLRHLLHHKKSTVVLFFHMYMLPWAVPLSIPICPPSIVPINLPN